MQPFTDPGLSSTFGRVQNWETAGDDEAAAGPSSLISGSDSSKCLQSRRAASERGERHLLLAN